MRRDVYSGFLFRDGLIIILITYFCLHGYLAHYGSVPVTGLGLLWLVMSLSAIVLQRIFRRAFANQGKATAFTAVLVLLVLFFGVFQDMIAGIWLLSTLGRLTIFFPLTIAIIVVFFFIVKRSGSHYTRFRKFLTTLVILYLLVDLFRLAQVTIFSTDDRSATNALPATQMQGGRPPVYLVLLDEYAGNETLGSYYGYPNSTFQQFLEDRRFHVVRNPTSNYHLTIYSMASMFSMNFLPMKGEAVISNHYAYKSALQSIEKNRVADLFHKMGYRVRNKSPFYFDGQPQAYSTGLLPDKMSLVQHQTIYYRLAKALPDLLAEQFGIRSFAERNARLADESNHRMIDEVLQDAANDSVPHFTYVHLMMPHEPLVRDSLGNKLGLTNYGAERDAAKVDTAYLQYLVYTNRAISVFIDSLQKTTRSQAVIMLMSDHGSRHLARKNHRFAFNNLYAIFLPGGNYESYKNGLSNVNAFPLLFNNVFGLKTPLLRDSVVN